MKAIIGLIPLYDDEKESYWMLPGYMKVIEAAGALPIMLPLTDDQQELTRCLEICDGILLTGGHDVEPSLYHAERSDKCGKICSLRDRMEAFIFQKMLEADKPVLGICRGIQLMNVLLGGTLYQDLPTEHPSDTNHHMESPYDRPIHNIEVLEDTILADLIGSGTHHVNSYHHQAIKEIAANVNIMAVAEDGIVEAISLPGKKYMMGIQWHPEFSYERDPECMKIVQAFVDACSSYSDEIEKSIRK